MDRKYLSLILALVMVLGTFTMANAAPTDNVKVDWLIEKGLVEGYDDGTFGLEKDITRAEAAAMIVRVQDLEVLATGYKSTKSQFKDVPTTHWANGYINVVAYNKVVNGYPDGTFKPDGKITYAEIIKMLVVVNGDIPAENPLVPWEVPYIQKALEVGILKDINISSYNLEANRGTIFEMIYNLMAKDLDKGLEAYKGIVIENTRVNGLDKDELAIEVIERNSGSASYRYNTGSNVRIKLKDVKGDTNHLLGKVINVTINENNEVSRFAIDETYSYLTGPTSVNKDEITINGKTYGVRDTNRYTNTMDKLVAVLHNDTEYRSMKDYFEKVGKSKEFTSDFSNVTMKGNSILFIDSFNFEDIAPIKETLEKGEVLHIYRDDANGTVTRVMPYTVLGYTEKGFKTLELKDIKANDVVHIYDRDKAIVRTDAATSGIYERYKESVSNSFIQVDGENHLVVETNKRRPVYSLDGIRFFTLFANGGNLDLDPLRNEKVTLLLDANDNLQSIIGNIKYDEGVFVIEETDRRSANVIGPNNGSSTIVVEFDSVLNFLGSNTNRAIGDFNRGDLVYLMKEGTRINKMVRMDTAANINAKAKAVAKSAKGNFELSKSLIRLEEPGNLFSNFEINNANVFIIEVDVNKVPKIVGTTIDDIIANVKPNSNLKAHIISNKDFSIMNLGNIKYGNEAVVAHTIVFTNFENANSKLTKEVIELTYKFTQGRDKVIEGKDIYGTTIKRNIDKYANLPALMPGDIVELGVDGDKAVVEVMTKIPKNDEVFKVIEIDRYSSSRARWVVLEDSKKVNKDYYILRDALEFGEVEEGDKVSISLNNAGDIDVIVVR